MCLVLFGNVDMIRYCMQFPVENLIMDKKSFCREILILVLFRFTTYTHTRTQNQKPSPTENKNEFKQYNIYRQQCTI